MNISLEHNTQTNQDRIPYFVRVEISSTTIDLDSIFRIPIFKQANNGTGRYNAEVCGFRVEAKSVDELVPLVERLLRGLVNMARLPNYVFIARRSHSLYPVYTVDSEVFVTTPGGPVFRHVELAKVRDYLSDYLHAVGELGQPGKSEKLHVRGVRGSTLALIRPIFYLKKRPRASDDNEFWAPVFLTDDESAIYTYAANGRREIDIAGGYEALLLRSQVAQALIADKRLCDNYDLRPDRLLPTYWERVKGTLKKLPGALSYDGVQLGMYKNGKFVVAVEHRAAEDRYSLFVSKDIVDLRDRAARDLVRRGLLSTPDAVQIKE